MKNFGIKTLGAILLILTSLTPANAQTTMTQEEKTPATGDVTVEIKTTLGDMTVRLYGDTPRHRDNFVKLVNEGYYDGVLFHRVIKDFMVQTGDPDSRNARPGQHLGSGDPSYTLEAEILYPKHFHKRGALAAARTGDQVNPQRRSSGSQFYIVTGRKFSTAELDRMEQQMQYGRMQQYFDSLAMAHRDTIMALQRENNEAGLKELQDKLVAETEAWAAENPFHLTAEQREAYSTVGGAPHLDGQYTVFGEVVKGLEVAEKIEEVETDSNDRPREDVRVISMKVVD